MSSTVFRSQKVQMRVAMTFFIATALMQVMMAAAIKRTNSARRNTVVAGAVPLLTATPSIQPIVVPNLVAAVPVSPRQTPAQTLLAAKPVKIVVKTPNSLKKNNKKVVKVRHAATQPQKKAAAPIKAKLNKLNAKLPTGFFTIPVYGSDKLKYYYTEIWVGNPPQKQSVIVDTGSDYLAFPCSNCQNGKCGKHNNPPMDIAKNKTAKPVACGQKVGNFVCGKKCHNKQCAFSRSYLEGSSLKGIVYQDKIGIVAPTQHQTGNVLRKPKLVQSQKTQQFPQVPGLYGCTMVETGLFRTQLANGIMGLAGTTNTVTTKPNFIDSLFASQKSKTKNFSLCLGTSGGFLTFGGYNAQKHIAGEKMQTVSYTRNYLISINNVGANGVGKGKFKSPMRAMLDSGTTFTYLRSDYFRHIRKQFNAFCKLKSTNGRPLCGGLNRWRGKRYCATYDKKTYGSTNNFFASYPRLYFGSDNGAQIIWFPKDYFMQSVSRFRNKKRFCISMRMQARGRPNSTLGSSFFRHYDIYFNRDEKKVSFVRSECDDKAKRAYPVYGIRELIRHARLLVSAMFGENATLETIILCLCGLLILVVFAVFQMMKKKEITDGIMKQQVAETAKC